MRGAASLVVGVLLVTAGCGGCGGGGSGAGDGGTDASLLDGTLPDGAAADADVPDVASGDGGGDGSAADAGDAGDVDAGDSVLTHHQHASRDGLYVQPTFTKAAAATMKLDKTFDGTISGHVYAQALFLEDGPGGKAAVFAFTESNQVTALDADTGLPLWQKTLGTPAQNSGAGCGNVHPIGITGTPVIDAASRTLYVSAAVGDQSAIQTHMLHALSVDDGSERAGFPVDLSTVGGGFSAKLENQRGALALQGGVVYVPFGGHYGDCGDYHGWTIGVPEVNPSAIKGYVTPAKGGGMWAPGGVAADGTDLYVASGNTFGASKWSGGEAIFRFHAGPSFTGLPADYFAPHDWKALDTGDVDIGGSGPVIVEAPGATPASLVLSLGKNGYVYLLDRADLGGVADAGSGDGVFNAHVVSGEIINAAAAVTTGAGTYVVLHGYGGATGLGCPTGAGDLVALKISATAPPKATVAWCADSQSEGEPMITTTDGHANAVVWVVGNTLRGWDVGTGAVVYDGSQTAGNGVSGVGIFTTPIAALGRIYIAGNDRVWMFHP